ncbi:hypothetical protein [Neolewinella agarilytica]|uniref:Uncharacterized protein n=1 Tax=Neolewinella agarilytica TaxID=478744 RepID=A0A1H9I8E5_9BACT|nr:hypothetical protein [Neolewinella agarilytica]SEQ70816.1 hypothetical protein SAMN05444359_11483 [Neolewinella agarilytica]
MTYTKPRYIVVLLGLFTCFPLLGQPKLDQNFLLNAFNSLSPVERFHSTRTDDFITYFTFHPVSRSNGAVRFYLSSTFTDENGKTIVESGRIIEMSEVLLPDEPLQLIVQPVVIYLNCYEFSRNDMKPSTKFLKEELNTWRACGYSVQQPTKITKG